MATAEQKYSNGALISLPKVKRKNSDLRSVVVRAAKIMKSSFTNYFLQCFWSGSAVNPLMLSVSPAGKVVSCYTIPVGGGEAPRDRLFEKVEN